MCSVPVIQHAGITVGSCLYIFGTFLIFPFTLTRSVDRMCCSPECFHFLHLLHTPPPSPVSPSPPVTYTTTFTCIIISTCYIHHHLHLYHHLHLLHTPPPSHSSFH